MKDQPEPAWPVHRDLQRYNTLLGIDLNDTLKRGGLWIEIGPGTAVLPMQPFTGTPGVKLAAIGPHARSLPEGIHFTQGSVPDDEQFLNAHRGRARLVTDVYGAVSYCEDPVQALIYGSLLLKEGGVFIAFTELYRFGELAAWDRIGEFFRAELQQTLSFETVSALGDDSHIYATCARVRIHGEVRAPLKLKDVFESAALAIGAPMQSKTLWTAKDSSAAIRRVDYARPAQPSERKAHSRS